MNQEIVTSNAMQRDPVKLRSDLDRLNQRDWWRWVAAIAIMLLNTASVFALSLPNLKRGLEEQRQLDIAVLGLFGLVLLFDIFSVYQQIEINRMRRQLAAEIGIAAAVEVLKRPAAAEPRRTDEDERQAPRFSLDRRLTVRSASGNKQTVVWGRTSDISTDGLGAVIPDSLAEGTEVKLELSLGDSDKRLAMDAVVCYRRGFLHGFKFTELTPAQSDAIQRVCAGVLSAVRETQSSPCSSADPAHGRSSVHFSPGAARP